MSTDAAPILNIVKASQDAAARWEKTELHCRSNKDRLIYMSEKCVNLQKEIDAKGAELVRCTKERDETALLIAKQEKFLQDGLEQYRLDKEVGSDEVIKKLQDKLTRQLKELEKTEAELQEAKK